MGDRCHCTLTWQGELSPANVAAIEDFGPYEISLERGEARFDEVNHGDLPNSIAQAMRGAGVPFMWRYEGGFDFNCGTYLEKETGEFIDLPTVKGGGLAIDLEHVLQRGDGMKHLSTVIAWVQWKRETFKHKRQRVAYKCPKCGSHEVRFDAWAEWDAETQSMSLQNVFEATACDACGAEGFTAIEVKL